MGDEADADWEAGLVEAGREEAANYYRDRLYRQPRRSKMTKPRIGAMPDFKSHEERDKYFRDHADYFTAIKKSGVGHYDRNEAKTLDEAIKMAQTKQAIGGGNYMIYAVIGQQSAFVQSVPETQPTVSRGKK